MTRQSTETFLTNLQEPITETETLYYRVTEVVTFGFVPSCYGPEPGIKNYCVPSAAVTGLVTANFAIDTSVYETQSMFFLSYTQTLANRIMKGSYVFVPAFTALGLADDLFNAMAVIVIGLLALMTVWMALKSRKHRNKHTKRQQRRASR